MATGKREQSDRPSDSNDAPGADGVGYGNPPQHAKFQPGQSGNPRGRPRGAKGRKQIVSDIANEMHQVVEDGRRQRRSTLELILLQLRNLAAQGNVQAFRAYHNLVAKYSPQESETRGAFLIVPEQLTIEEFEQKMVEVQAYQRRLAEEWATTRGRAATGELNSAVAEDGG